MACNCSNCSRVQAASNDSALSYWRKSESWISVSTSALWFTVIRPGPLFPCISRQNLAFLAGRSRKGLACFFAGWGKRRASRHRRARPWLSPHWLESANSNRLTWRVARISCLPDLLPYRFTQCSLCVLASTKVAMRVRAVWLTSTCQGGHTRMHDRQPLMLFSLQKESACVATPPTACARPWSAIACAHC